MEGQAGVRRKRGRPRLHWVEYVENDPRRIGVGRWRRVANDRSVWRKIVGEAKPTPPPGIFCLIYFYRPLQQRYARLLSKSGLECGLQSRLRQVEANIHVEEPTYQQLNSGYEVDLPANIYNWNFHEQDTEVIKSSVLKLGTSSSGIINLITATPFCYGLKGLGSVIASPGFV
ncbi:unnamed protein product [Nezara viridula]|uniref:Uncharacterized protein n=1 Tax=Nezara viridula TaxID=85310 RepID=A0A9P0HIM0_NEZVI|nr:unnamed protein product [Nezara viridula]